MTTKAKIPEITLIVPCYNLSNGGVEFFKDCVQSFKNQTVDNFEIIFVDDGSSDNTLQIIKQNTKVLKNAVVIDAPHKGVSNARNAGIAAAKGNYICFADADDVVSPHFLEMLYSTITSTQADVTFCDMKLVKYNFKLSKNQKRPKPKISVYKTSEDAICELCLMRNNPFCSCWNKIIKRETLQKLAGYPNVFDTQITCSEDYLFCFNLYDIADKISYLHNKLYYYRKNCNSTVRKPFNISKLTSLVAADKVIAACQDKYPEALGYAKGSKGWSLYYSLLGMYKDKFDDTALIQKLLDDLKNYYKYNYKLKRQPLHRKIFWRFAYPFAKMLMKKQLKTKDKG